jgi:hypothetical protein
MACPYIRFFLISYRVLPRRGGLSPWELAGLAPAIRQQQGGVHSFPPGEGRVGEPPGRRGDDERKQRVRLRRPLLSLTPSPGSYAPGGLSVDRITIPAGVRRRICGDAGMPKCSIEKPQRNANNAYACCATRF